MHAKVCLQLISLMVSSFGMQLPMFVATKMTRGFNAPPLLVPSTEVYSKASIRWIGYEHICVPYWFHSVQQFIMLGLPEALLDWYIFEFFLKIHNRKLKN